MFFLEAAAATEAVAGETQNAGLFGGGILGNPIIFMVLMLGVFYFLMIRPENKKKKKIEEMRNNLNVGDEITTIGGINGTVVNIKDELIVIEVGADRVRLEFNKWAVSTNNSAMREAEKAKVAAAAKRKEEKEAKKKKKD